jgi:hypothetical protein
MPITHRSVPSLNIKKYNTRYILCIDDDDAYIKNLSLSLYNKFNGLHIDVSIDSASNFLDGMNKIEKWNNGNGYSAIIVDKILDEIETRHSLLSPVLLCRAEQKDSRCHLFFISGQPIGRGAVADIIDEIDNTTALILPKKVRHMQKGKRLETELFELLSGG